MTDDNPPPSATSGDDSPGTITPAAIRQSTSDLIQSILDRSSGRPSPLTRMNDEERARLTAITDRTSMRKHYGRGAGLAVIVQIGVVDWIFFQYLSGNEWNVPGEVMITWLTATVVQAIGVVLVITRSLFGSDD